MKRRGIVKGQAIEFDEPIGLPEGQCVEIDIWPVYEEAAPVEEASPGDDEDPARYDSPAYRTFRPMPARGRVVTKEMVDELLGKIGY